MNRILPILFAILTVVLIAVATVRPSSHAPAARSRASVFE